MVFAHKDVSIGFSMCLGRGEPSKSSLARIAALRDQSEACAFGSWVVLVGENTQKVSGILSDKLEHETQDRLKSDISKSGKSKS